MLEAPISTATATAATPVSFMHAMAFTDVVTVLCHLPHSR
mgnify:CR=1 FL=1|tara:strand:+ start:2232 stop:2351 length:120 start_codon:yes stop_codon:yes gene_type:complete